MHWRLKSKLTWYLGLLSDMLLVPFVVLMPRNRRKIVFGAWSGRQYSCNPRYLMEYVLGRGGFTCVWVGERHLRNEVLKHKGAKFAAKGSLAALWHCLTAGVYACNVQWRMDIAWIPRCRRVKLLYLTHGSPDKKTGALQLDGQGGSASTMANKRKGIIRGLIGGLISSFWDFCYDESAWCSATSPVGEEIRLSNMPFRLSKDRMLHCGTPRFDFMIHHAKDENLKNMLRGKYSRILGLPVDKRWILYVPTWRHNLEDVFSFTNAVQVKRLQKQLDTDGAILIEKHHPIILERGTVNGGQFGSVFVISREQSLHIDMQEILLASDRLITDYSSIYYDYYLVNRPVIHYIYDYEHFMNVDMGFNFDIRNYGGGPFAETEDELLKYLAMTDDALIARRNEKTREHLMYETGHSCEGYYKLLERLAE